MEALFSSLVAKYGFDIAAKMLGLDQQEQNPKYAISLGGMNLNPVNMIQRAALNTGIKSLLGGNLSSVIGPTALLGGAVMLGRAFDPLNPDSRNYSPNLSGQIDYLSERNMIGRNPNMGSLQYGPDSVLRGQNVISLFGTNNYQDQLQNFIDKQQKKKAAGKNYSEKMLDKALAEKKELFDYKADIKDKAKVKSAAPTYTPPSPHSGGGGGNQRQRDAGPGFSGSGTAAEMGSFRRGGIASLHG